MNWLPIDTDDPHGGLALVCAKGEMPVVAHFVFKEWVVYVPGMPIMLQPRLIFDPTHFMPIPDSEGL